MTPARRFTVACSALGVLAAIGNALRLTVRDARLGRGDVATVHQLFADLTEQSCHTGHAWGEWAPFVDRLALRDGREVRAAVDWRHCLRCGRVQRKETTA